MKCQPKIIRSVVCLLITISLVNGAKNPRVVIVGAGAAGLATASRLYRGGITNIIILEALNRTGGRIKTTAFSRGVADLGAQWCHGEKGNVVYELASAHPGLLKASIVADDAALVQSNGVRVAEELVEKLSALAEEIIQSEERKLYAGSLGDFFAEKYWQRLQTEPTFSDVDRELAEQFLVFRHNYERSNSAYDSWFEVAANETDSYQDTEGNQALAWNATHGYSTILDILTGSYEEPTNNTNQIAVPINNFIQFEKYVTNIQWNEANEGYVRITTDDGSHYEADHVVVTVSLGVLKENYRTMFTPALPIVNQQAIDGINFGTVNKIFVLYDSPIPEELPNSVTFLWRKPELEALQRSEHAWAETVMTVFRIDDQPNVLCFWVNGRHHEPLPDDVIRAGLAYLLRIYLKNLSFGNELDFMRSKWFSDCAFRGSYSSRSIMTEKLGTGAQYLASPLTNNDGELAVLFAGEATSRYHFSTVHGAIESGFREADRLLDLYK